MVVSVRKISPRRMVLDFRPVNVWTYRVAGLVLMICGVVVTLVLADKVSFSCSRFSGMCQYQHSDPLGSQESVVIISDLRGGRVGTQTSGLVAGMTLYVMRRGLTDLAIPLVAADGETKDSLAKELTRFSTDTTALEFDVHEDRQVIGYGFGAFLFGAGLVCLLAIERVRLILDRDKGLVQLRRRRFMWSRGVRAKLVRVKGVKALEHRFRRTASWSVALQMEDGSELPLTVLPLFTAISADQAQQLIRRWLA